MASLKTIHAYMLTLNFLCFKKRVYVCILLKIDVYTVYCDYDFPPVKSPISSPLFNLETPHFLSLSIENKHQPTRIIVQSKTKQKQKTNRKNAHKYLHIHTKDL